MQFNIKWNSYNDSLITIWSFEIIVQINHNTNAVNHWHWHECSDTFNLEWWKTYLNGKTTIKPWVWVDFMPMNSRYGKSIVSPLGDQMVTVYKRNTVWFLCIKKETCYSKFQISLFLLVTRQKKFIEDDCLKLLTITWLCIFASYHAIFSNYASFNSLYRISTKS